MLISSKLVEILLNKSGRIVTSPMRIMPSFLIIGAKKCGTTSLFKYLTQHPNIGAPTNKEISYFNINYGKGILWYKSLFPLYPLYLPGFDSQHLITGEATAEYICHPETPKRIAETLPQVKLIALLRNPVDRAYSHYHHSKRIGREDLSFEEAIAQEKSRVKQIETKSYQPNSNLYGAYNYTYLSSGLYADQLKNWLNLFDRQQLLILKSENFFSYPEIVFERVLDFLNLPNWSPKNFQKYNYNQYTQTMIPNTKKRLMEYFYPHNQQLYQLLGKNFDWDE